MWYRSITVLLMCLGSLGVAGARVEPSESGSAKPTPGPTSGPTSTPSTRPAFPALVTPLKNIDGTPMDLMKLKGRVILLVPVAWDSNRRQFEELQLYVNRVGDQGLVVIGVLTADFGAEARSDKELEQAIRDRYKITFPLAATTKTKGADAHPLFEYLTSKLAGHEFGGELKGPFTKFVINRNGELAIRWEPAERINNSESFQRVISVLHTPMR